MEVVQRSNATRLPLCVSMGVNQLHMENIANIRTVLPVPATCVTMLTGNKMMSNAVWIVLMDVGDRCVNTHVPPSASHVTDQQVRVRNVRVVCMVHHVL